MEKKGWGFTLVELVVGLGVLSLGFAGVLAMVLTLTRVQGECVAGTRAMLCAQEGLERLRFELRAGIRASGAGKTTHDSGPYRGMEIAWRVKAADSFAGVWEVRFACACRSGGRTISRELCTLVADGA